jgi:hypothetical protein
MAKINTLLRSLLPIGIFLQLLYYFLFEEALWLFFLALICMIAGTIYGMQQEWKRGHKTSVKLQLAAMGLFLFIIGGVIAFKHL